MVRYSIQVALLLFVAVYAWRKGGRPERQIASILVGMHVASLVLFWIVGPSGDIDEVPIARIGLDVIGLGLFVAVALRANRWWTLCLASLQLVTVFAHILRMVDADLPILVYFLMERWPFWLMIVITGIGTNLNSRRVQNVAPTSI